MKSRVDAHREETLEDQPTTKGNSTELLDGWHCRHRIVGSLLWLLPFFSFLEFHVGEDGMNCDGWSSKVYMYASILYWTLSLSLSM